MRSGAAPVDDGRVTHVDDSCLTTVIPAILWRHKVISTRYPLFVLQLPTYLTSGQSMQIQQDPQSILPRPSSSSHKVFPRNALQIWLACAAESGDCPETEWDTEVVAVMGTGSAGRIRATPWKNESLTDQHQQSRQNPARCDAQTTVESAPLPPTRPSSPRT